MATDANAQVSRRGFLKGAAAGAAGAAALTVPGVAPIDADAQLPAQARPVSITPEQAARSLASETTPLPDEPDVQTVEDPGSDFMVDVLKTLGFEYIAANPASSFRGLHESLINYGGNKGPEWLTCCHEQASVNIANGYYAVAGKPMAVITFAPSGLHHAMMGIFGAFSGHTPTYILVANILDGKERRPQYRLGRAFRDGPRGHGSRHGQVGRHAGIAAALRGVGRACLQDGDDRAARSGRARRRRHAAGESRSRQVQAPHPEVDAHDVRRPAIPEPWRRSAKLLVAAENPLIIAGDVARDEEGMRLLVELAETLQAPVQGGGRGMPNQHPLSGGGNVRTADVILALERGWLVWPPQSVSRSAGAQLHAAHQA